MKTLCLYLCLVVGILGAEEAKKPAPVMPPEVTLTTGRVLRKVEVIRWEKDRVVLKYSGGVDPIAFSLIKSITPEQLAELKAQGMERANIAAETKKLAAQVDAMKGELQRAREESDKRMGEAREAASRNGRLMEGQNYEQVRLALGTGPSRSNDYASGREEQRIYELQQETFYVYFSNGIVTSWQRSDRRR